MKIAIILIERTVPGIRELMDAVSAELGAQIIRDMIDLGATHAYRKERNQYRAEVLLKELSRFAYDADFTLFIFREDMFAGNLNFIFGIASGKMGIVSTTRLDPRFYGEVDDPAQAKELFQERLIKEVLHELGHTLGLPHCENKKCVMVFSNSIEDVDYKGSKFCERCRELLQRKE
jgi:archaemetzincin